MLFFGVGLSLALDSYGCLAGFDNAALDTYLLVRAPKRVEDIVLVEVGEADYRNLFHARSPLDEQVLAELVRAIQAGSPAVVVVDIDTSASSMGGRLLELGCSPPVVWGQDALIRNGEAEPLPFADDSHTRSPCASGLSVFPMDADGIVRRYRRFVEAGARALPTLPMVAAGYLRFDTGSSGAAAQHDLVLNFSGDRYAFVSFTAAQVLEGSKGIGWPARGPLTGRTVVLGGTYRAARDEYATPVGPMAGAHLVAQALASEIHHGGIQQSSEWFKLAVEAVVGLVVIAIHYALRPVAAMLVSVFVLPLAAFLGSWLVFSTLGYWVTFVPLVACVLLDQIKHHLDRFAAISQDHGQLAEENRQLRSALLAQPAGSGAEPTAPHVATSVATGPDRADKI